ncbi:MAG TPA: PLDc N-terminal domain-containing protein [Candidatus Dormibacteraeota bacterium]|nr:PLDc N-terminal domain-containing protein [Candidatus Dormibacteraeota bacterium]
MLTEVILASLLVGAALWVVAMRDVVRSTDLDPTGRIILAAALIVVPPLGFLLWLVMRAGWLGVLIAVAGAALTVAIVAGIVAASSPGGILRSVQVQQGGAVSGGGSAAP